MISSDLLSASPVDVARRERPAYERAGSEVVDTKSDVPATGLRTDPEAIFQVLLASDSGNREYRHERGDGGDREGERGQCQPVAQPAGTRRRVGEPPDAGGDNTAGGG